jgi:hypothetical protein
MAHKRKLAYHLSYSEHWINFSVSLISWFNKYQHLKLCGSTLLDWYLGLKHSLALLHHIRYLDAKSSTLSSLMYGSLQPSPCWSFFNHHHDPHNSLYLQWAYVDNFLKCWCRRIGPHILNIFCDNNRYDTYFINSFSSCLYDIKDVQSYWLYICLDEWIALI